jgi:hypothetical protein
MKLPKSRILDEMWSTHQVLLNLGFRADDIYVYDKCLDSTGELCIGVVLRTQGLQWVGYFGTPDDGTDSMAFLENDWPTHVDHMKSVSTEEQKRVYEASHAWTHKVDLVSSLIVKGFDLPYRNRKSN